MDDAASSEDRYYTRPGDIYGVLRALEKDRSTINIQFHDSTTLYNSMVLRANLRQRRFQLDEITPAKGHDKALAGEPFSIRASVRGIQVYIPETRIVDSGSDDGGPYFNLAFPERLLYLQRRNAYRVTVPNRREVSGVCHFRDRVPFSVEIENLSATGILIRLPAELDGRLQSMESFRLELALPDGEPPLTLQAQVIHFQLGSQRKALICGCRFVDIDQRSHIRLNRFITQAQRESLV